MTADRQTSTHTHGHHNTPLPIGGGVMSEYVRSPDGLGEMFAVVTGAVSSHPLRLDVESGEQVTLTASHGADRHRHQ